MAQSLRQRKNSKVSKRNSKLSRRNNKTSKRKQNKNRRFRKSIKQHGGAFNPEQKIEIEQLLREILVDKDHEKIIDEKIIDELTTKLETKFSEKFNIDTNEYTNFIKHLTILKGSKSQFDNKLAHLNEIADTSLINNANYKDEWDFAEMNKLHESYKIVQPEQTEQNKK